jgi:hypothetical protein
MPKINLEIRTSFWLLLLLIGLHLGAAIAVIVSTVSYFKPLFICMIFVSLLVNLRKFVWLVSQIAIVSIRELPDGDWQLIDRKGFHRQAKLRGNSLRTTFLIILNFAVPGKRLGLSVPIFVDAIGADQFRRLSVHLLCVDHKKLCP